MKKLGFTLGEVLITLGIVGVIAAVTVPAVIMRISSNTNVTALARAYELLQTATADTINIAQQDDSSITTLSAIQVKNIFAKPNDLGLNGDDYITSLDGNDNNNFSTISIARGHTGIFSYTPANENYLTSIKNYNGNDLGQDFFENTELYKFNKQVPIIIYRKIKENEITAAINANNLNSDTVLTKIFVDTNAENSPNMLGQDIFLFGLSNSGKLIPAGSDEYNKNIFDESVDNSTTACANSADNTFDALSCTARVMIDGWKINY